MNRQRSCVVFVTISPQGFLQLEGAQMAVAVRNAVHTETALDAYIATLDSNADSPAWNFLRKAYESNRILSAANTAELIEQIEKLFSEYENILLEFAGGMNTLKHLIPVKRKYGKRFRIVASVWYYRNGTWLGGICSFVFAILYLKYVDRVIFGCPYAARNFTFSSLLFRKGRACIMPLAGTSSDEGDIDTAWKILSERNLGEVLQDKSVFKIVYMAQFRRLKNHVWLTKALLPVIKEHRNIHVIYCGAEGDVSFEQIRSLARAEHLESNFHMPGRLPYEAIPTILKNVDCAIVPSYTETYGFTYVEPMMFGVPVIGTRIGVGEYAIQDYFNGFSFSLSSPEDFRYKVRFLVENRDMTYRMGQNAKRFADETYSMSRVALMRVSLYQSILGLRKD